ncbi:hypothetical protein MPSEU_000768600 [Mayamaea pseudoterrestris]|nr:hypothetical protein MPSEU_000768600 [Mayamaea pseudoterrestris]
MTENMLEDGYTYTRDAQYGWDTLLENIIDLSHLPWAHHGQQGTRDDTVVMNITAIGKPSEQGMKFSFDDKTMALDRTGLLDFRAPFFMLLYSQLQPKSKDDMPKYFDMNLVMIPTKPGWNRLIVCTGSGKRSGEEMAAGSANDSTQAATKKLPKASVFGRVYRRLPVWIKHQFTHKIIDADIILLHKQEEERTTNRGVDYEGYCMPATSDRVITPIRRWVSKYAHIPSLSINGDGSGGRVVLPEPPVQRSVLFDRWSQHSDQCKHCHKALDGVKTWRRNNFMIMAVSIIAAKFLAARVALVGCLAMWRLLHVAEESLTKGQCDHYKNH